MTQIYSASIQVRQMDEAPVVTASILFTEYEHAVDIDLHWELPHAIEADGNAGEWLYAVLSRVVQDYDDHTLNRVKIETTPLTEDKTNG